MRWPCSKLLQGFFYEVTRNGIQPLVKYPMDDIKEIRSRKRQN
jgi:hypothetical protein